MLLLIAQLAITALHRPSTQFNALLAHFQKNQILLQLLNVKNVFQDNIAMEQLQQLPQVLVQLVIIANREQLLQTPLMDQLETSALLDIIVPLVLITLFLVQKEPTHSVQIQVLLQMPLVLLAQLHIIVHSSEVLILISIQIINVMLVTSVSLVLQSHTDSTQQSLMNVQLEATAQQELSLQRHALLELTTQSKVKPLVSLVQKANSAMLQDSSPPTHALKDFIAQ